MPFKKILLLFFLFQILSCKKDKIEGDFSPLIGKWRWIMKTGGLSGQTNYPLSIDERVIEFIEKGKYKIYNNGEKGSKGWIINEGNHIVFKPCCFEKAKDDLTWKNFYPANIRNDSLFLTNSKPADTIDAFIDIYIRK